MHKTLVVMRHAKAQRPADGRPDIDRELSEAGRRALTAALRLPAGMWPAPGRTEVWTSPAVRARQSAELLLQALRERDVDVAREATVVESLWDGGDGELLDAVRASRADVIALVGHNPFAEELVRALSGSSIGFSTGALAALDVAWERDRPFGRDAGGAAGASEPSGRLLWFVQGSSSRRWKTLVDIEEAIREAAETASRRYGEFLGNPDDIETLHALRVSLRTLRSLVAFVKPWQERGQNAQVQEELRDVARCTSRLRELDVLWSQVRADGGFSPEFADFCAKAASAERARVVGELGGRKSAKRIARAHEELNAVRWKRKFVREGLDAAEARARFDRMAEALREEIGSLDLADADRTHDVRKRAKRVRYAAERFKGVIGQDTIPIAKDMTAHQDDLGAICDARANIALASELASEGPPETIAWELALLRARHEAFLYERLRDARR